MSSAESEALAVVDVVVDKGIEASSEKKQKKVSKSGKKKKDKSKKPQEMPQQPQEKPKPLMDLRHILKKYEKKVEQKPIQQVDFFGSMSAIPFLKTNEPKELKKKMKKKAPGKSSIFDEKTKDKVNMAAPAADAVGDSDEATKKTEEERMEETRGERNTISYLGVDGKEKKIDITIMRDYNEEQLNLWKRMIADDGDDMMDDGPVQMSARPKTEKKRPANFIIGHNRPDEWLNPDLKTQDKLTYKVIDEVAEEIPPLQSEEVRRTSEK
jgi:hypothetical protein